VLFFIFSGSSFSIIILLLLGIGLLQMLTSSSRQYYEPPEYLGNSGPSSDVHVSYVEEPVKPKATFDAQYCIECGSKLGRKEVYCRFCGTRQ
jgi:ribosomal protein L40E